MHVSFEILVFLVIVALAFDFLNGLHDAANSVATIVATRVLQPHWAVLFAATFNFLAIFIFGLHVAETVGKGIIDAQIIDPTVIFAALMGAIVWNVLTWLLGIPSSSSHALIGGLLGAGVTKAGLSAVVWSGVTKTVLAIALSPTIGMILALLLVLAVAWTSLKLTPLGVDKRFRRLQLVSSAAYSLGHGANDAQKTMGIIAVLLYSQGMLGDTFYVPWWVVISCYLAIAAGTMSGGWRIVKTMGSKITRLTPAQGFCAETGAAIMLYAATALGIPVSSTHTITGAIVGVGASRRLSAVRWNVASNIVVAWVVTLPAAGLIAAATWWITNWYVTAGAEQPGALDSYTALPYNSLVRDAADREIAETPAFTRQRRGLGVSGDDYTALLDVYAVNPRYGKVIVGTGGLRKGRVAKSGTGKSGGYRVFSLFLGEDRPVFLLWIIDKTADENINAAQKTAFKNAIDAIKLELAR